MDGLVQRGFEIEINAVFGAAYKLTGIGGPDSALHGHTFNVSVTISTEEFDESLGLAVHHRNLRKVVAYAVSRLDYSFLNDLNEFEGKSPTLENISRVLFSLISESLPNTLCVQGVKVQVDNGLSVKYVDKLKT